MKSKKITGYWMTILLLSCPYCQHDLDDLDIKEGSHFEGEVNCPNCHEKLNVRINKLI